VMLGSPVMLRVTLLAVGDVINNDGNTDSDGDVMVL
jgi:hypothetical protein